MKLSKGVLGLKFMRKTRDQLEQTETEKKHRKYFQGDDDDLPLKTEAASSSAVQASVRICPSYLQVERYTYARQSYGGMNPTVEENIRKGLWQMEFEIPLPDEEETAHSSRPVKKEPTEEGELSSNSDDDLNAPVYGSLIATIGKRFNRKNKMKRPHDDLQDNLDEGSLAPKKKKKTLPRWKKSKSSNNNNAEGTNEDGS